MIIFNQFIGKGSQAGRSFTGWIRADDAGRMNVAKEGDRQLNVKCIIDREGRLSEWVR